MSRIACCALFLALISLARGFGREAEEHPSEASRVLATYAPRAAEGVTAEARAGAAHAFIDALDDELRARCLFELESLERANWTNLPPGADEAGVRLGELDAKQLERACDLLAAVLSGPGYAKTRDILLADDRLLRDGAPRVGFGAENFWLLVFGTPAADGKWALQLDGHHLALNLAFDGERVSMAPTFLGAQPSAFEREGKPIVPLRTQVDSAFALIAALDDEQRAAAIVGPKRAQIEAGAGRDGFVPEPVGVACSTFDDAQRGVLDALLRAYVGDLPMQATVARMNTLASEFDQMHFAWWGPTENPSDVSYRLQGPTVLIEYACQGMGGNALDHLHSIYREPGNEYGASTTAK